MTSTSTDVQRKGNKMKALTILPTTFLLLLLSTAAFADSVKFSYGDGSTLFVQGALTGTLNGGLFTATSATGTYNGKPISLVAPGVDGAFAYNNLVYFPPVAGYSVDLYGLLFNVAGLGDVNLCGTAGCAGSDSYTNISNFGGLVNTNVTATFDSPTSTPTPEPGTLLMLGSAMIGLGGVLRRKINL
jgi:hypothetical protein